MIDLTLPAMDGSEVCRRINLNYPDIPVIVTSGSSISMEAVREQGASVSAIFSKPFEMQDLLNAIGVATAKDTVAGRG